MSSGSIRVRVQANARKSEVVGVREGVLIVRVAAPALEGRANEAVRRLLAKRLRVAPSRVAILRGARSRDKLVGVAGMDPEDLELALDQWRT
jgi:uncharacterized protein